MRVVHLPEGRVKPTFPPQQESIKDDTAGKDALLTLQCASGQQPGVEKSNNT